MQDKHRRVRFYCGLTDKYGECVDPVTYEQTMEEFYHSFTVYRTTGNWKGMAEESVVLEVIELWPLNTLRQTHLESRAYAVAKLLKVNGQQHCVMFTTDFVDAIFM